MIEKSFLGYIAIAVSANGIRSLILGDDPDRLRQELKTRLPYVQIENTNDDIEQLVSKVFDFTRTAGAKHDFQLDLCGTEFQLKVWGALCNIPSGSTKSYSEIATEIGLPKAARAVAQACRANPIAVLIPCHRVVSKDGALSGYRWGLERKRWLLEREGAR